MALPKKLEPKEKLEKAFNVSKRSAGKRGSVFVAFADANNFKQVNDNHGHLKGDEVLETIANILADNIRNSDRLIRFGGDEFVFILNNLEEAEAEKAVKRIQVKINGNKLLKTMGVTLSIGIEKFDESRHKEYKGIIHSADMLMYEAKKTKKDTIFGWKKAS